MYSYCDNCGQQFENDYGDEECPHCGAPLAGFNPDEYEEGDENIEDDY